MDADDADHRSFAQLLRTHREAAFLSQEALAARAGLSVRAISDLERGIKQRPHNETVELLIRALELTDEQAAAFKMMARRRRHALSQTREDPIPRPSPESSAVQSTSAEADGTGHRLPERPTSNLPLPLTSFIGREQAQARVRELLGSHRLVTLTGAAGCGKTRLAVQVAGAMVESYADGVWLAELAAVADPVHVPAALAEAVGAREEPGRSGLETLIAHLCVKHALLVLDNCEHLIDTCAELAAGLLRACPQVRILATSREELGVAGEQLYRVPSLSLPPTTDLPADEIRASEAVQLFVERAQTHAAGFALSEATLPSVVEICTRLDGIPLAIELAAARVRVLPVQSIAARLDDSFRLLTRGPRTVLPRQQTLRAALDWSYDLLSEPERTLLGRLAVFAGGWSLEAAETICKEPTIAHDASGSDHGQAAGGQPAPVDLASSEPGLWHTGLGAEDVLDLLTQLVSKSLVVADKHGSDVRYHLLEIVRQYAHERLMATGTAALIQQWHAWYYLHLAEEAEPALAGPEQAAWLARLALEHANLRAALHWAYQTGAVEFGLRLAGTLWRFWQVRGHVSEGRQWLQDLIALAEGAGGPIADVVLAKAYDGAGALARVQGEYAHATMLCQRALQLRRAAGDATGGAASLNSLGLIAYQQADYVRAAAYYEESLAVYRDLGDRIGSANVLNNLGMVAADQGEYGRAVACYEASLEQFRDLGHRRNCANVLNNLGGIRMQLGEHAAARVLFEESLAMFDMLEDQGGMALVLELLGELATREGQLEQAATYHRRSLTLARGVGGRELIAWNLHDLAAVALMRALQPDRATPDASWKQAVDGQGSDRQQAARADWLLRAVHLFGAATGLRAVLGAPLPPAEQPWYDRLIEEAHRSLGPDMFQRAWSAGEAWPVDEAIAYALSERLS